MIRVRVEIGSAGHLSKNVAFPRFQDKLDNNPIRIEKFQCKLRIKNT